MGTEREASVHLSNSSRRAFVSEFVSEDDFGSNVEDLIDLSNDRWPSASDLGLDSVSAVIWGIRWTSTAIAGVWILKTTKAVTLRI